MSQERRCCECNGGEIYSNWKIPIKYVFDAKLYRSSPGMDRCDEIQPLASMLWVQLCNSTWNIMFYFKTSVQRTCRSSVLSSYAVRKVRWWRLNHMFLHAYLVTNQIRLNKNTYLSFTYGFIWWYSWPSEPLRRPSALGLRGPASHNLTKRILLCPSDRVGVWVWGFPFESDSESFYRSTI